MASARAERPLTAKAGAKGPPVARTVDARDEFAGQTLSDPYRWMEGADNGEFIAWLEAQGQYASKELARSPGRDKLLARVRELGLGTSIISEPIRVGDRLFYEAEPAGAQVSRLEVREADGKTRVLVDPAALGKGGVQMSIDNFSPSPDGKLVAYNLNPGGSEITSIHVIPSAGGPELADTVEHVWGEFSAHWLPDSSGFFYTQMAEPVAGVDPMFNKRVRLHRLGRPVVDDRAVLGNGIGTTMRFAPEEFTVAIHVPLGSSTMIARGAGAHPEQRIAVAQLSELDSSGARLRRLAWSDHAPTTVTLPYPGSIDSLSTDERKAGAIVQVQGWTQPAEIFAYDPGTNQLSSTGLRTTTPVDPSRFRAEEVEIASADGTRIPLSVLSNKDLTRDGSHPTIVFGYGAYADPLPPWFSPSLAAWLERGGVFAVCHVRGGGEKGEAWHQAGARNNKKKGVDDFIACGEQLIQQGYTSSARLAAQGRSMGGVLIGRVITARPNLFAAAQIGVGILNPLRIVHAENGANQLDELGSPETAEGLRGLVEMDPYLHVAKGVSYPAVLFTVGLHDARVSPWMTGKMAARLQASTSSGRPVLVRVDANSGHGIGSTRDQVYAERVDQWSFLLAAFKDPEFAPQ